MGKVYLTLDEVLTRRSISRYELAKRTGIRYPIIDNYYKNKVVRYDSYVLEKICSALYKDKKFAAGCSRDVINTGAERLGWTIEELMEKTILAMRSCEERVNQEMETLA